MSNHDEYRLRGESGHTRSLDTNAVTQCDLNKNEIISSVGASLVGDLSSPETQRKNGYQCQGSIHKTFETQDSGML